MVKTILLTIVKFVGLEYLKKNQGEQMRIGVVVHGPNIIDSGYALKLIDLLGEYGQVTARLGGTMGRTAVIDASLEDIINIRKKLVPSDSLKIFHDDEVDVIFLLNYGKSDVTGQVFGYKVYNHYADKIDKMTFLSYRLKGRVRMTAASSAGMGILI